MNLTTVPRPTPPARRSGRRRLIALAAVAATAGPAILAANPAGAAAPPARGTVSCHQVDFDDATVTSVGSTDPFQTKHVVTVTGGLAEPAKVTLVEAVYVRQPEHWELAVTACSATDGSVSIAPPPEVPPLQLFQATFAFVGPLGTCGIEVAGATIRQTFDLGGPGCAR